MGAKRKFIQFQVSEDLHKEIRKHCAEWGINISEMMREAVKMFIESGNWDFFKEGEKDDQKCD